MIEVNEQFKRAVYAPIRKTTAKIVFEVLDNEAYSDATPTATSNAPISRINQIYDKVRTMSNKYATFERDYFKLDGSFKIPPRPDEGDANLGWWSGGLCGADGIFQTPQALTIDFSEGHNSMGLTIVFDRQTNEYAVDFEIRVYQANDVLIASAEITSNTKTAYEWVNGIDEYRKIVIIIKKWSRPYGRVKIAEIDFGVFNEFADDKLIKLNLIEQMNVVGDTLPANEIKFVIDNSSKEFNILNPQGFYRFLKERQEISLKIGLETGSESYEYIDMMGYYLSDWQSDEGALTMTLTARNIFDLLDKDYEQGAVTNLFELAVDVLTKANVSNYFIHPSLQGIPTTGFTDKVTYRKALQCVGIASKSAVYQNRSGTVIIEPFVELDENTAYIVFTGLDAFAGTITPTVYSGYDMKNISFDNVYKEPQISLDKLIQTLVMVVHSDGAKTEHSFENEGVKEGAALKCDNPLIQSFEQAESVARWILTESNLRALYRVNWRQNPALECGDIVFIEDSFGAEKQSRITKQEFEYMGYLTGKTEAKGGV